MGIDKVEQAKQNATSTKKTAPKRQTRSRAKISKVDRDVLVAEAQGIVKLWASADRTMGNADAKAVHCLVAAQEAGFFGRGKTAAANLNNWHKIATKQNKTAVADSVLHDLFCIEKPTAADRQRLQRVQYIVPAILKAGGTGKFQLSNSGAVMLEVDTPYFKACEPKTEATGRVALSIAKLDKGARQYLKAEMPAAKRTKKQKTKNALDSVAMVDVFKRTGDLVRKTPQEKLTVHQRAALQVLLVDLLGMFCANKEGELNTDTVNEIYSTDGTVPQEQAA